MQSGDDDATCIHSSGDVDSVRTSRAAKYSDYARRGYLSVPLTSNKERFTQAYLAGWFEGLAAKENCPKLAAKATLYAGNPR